MEYVGTLTGSANESEVDRARQAAADFVEDTRRGLRDADGVFQASPRIVQAGLLATARLYARRGAALGVANYGEFAAQILRGDPDIDRMLGVGRYARPAVG